MDPKIHPLTTVVMLVDSMRPADRGTYCLYVEHHELQICRAQLVPKDAPRIAVISALDINTGLTTERWNHIEAVIRTLVKKGVIEWHRPKP